MEWRRLGVGEMNNETIVFLCVFSVVINVFIMFQQK